MAVHPIWKRYEVDLASYIDADVPYVDFEIRDNGRSIYNGRAFWDSDDELYVPINEMCADYLSRTALPTVASTTDYTDTAAVHTFTVYVGSTLVDTVKMINDWSYVDSPTARTKPICGDFVPLMPVIYSAMVGDVLHHYKSTYTPYSGDVTLGGVLRKNLKGNFCNPVVLYYANSLGGYDYLLLHGIRPAQDYDRKTYDKHFAFPYAAKTQGKEEYFNAVTDKFQCFTGNISREGGLNMGELLGSPAVWMWDIHNGFRPVLVDETSAQMLTVRNNGRQAVRYSFNVTLAQNRQRR